VSSSGHQTNAFAQHGGRSPRRRKRLRVILPALVVCLFVMASSRLEAATCLTESRCATELCLFNDPQTWTNASCGTSPGIPRSTDSWQVLSGHTVVYAQDATVVGPGVINGVLTYDLSASGRNAQGFRTLIVRTTSTLYDLTINAGGILRLRQSDRLFFDTSAGGQPGILSVQNGGLLDAQGSVYDALVTTLLDQPADVTRCGTSQGRAWILGLSTGIENARVGRRLLFKSGRARNRQFEIVAVDKTAQTVTLCTVLADARSLGQRLTPHASFNGPRTKPGSQHLQPTVVNAASVAYAVPAAGDQVALINDVWFDQSSGTAGYYIVGPNTADEGNDPLPILQAINANRIGGGTAIVCIGTFTPKSSTQSVPAFVYNNIHDLACAAPVRLDGWTNATIAWNAIHDDRGSDDTQGGLYLLNEATYCPACPLSHLTISDNILYRLRGNHIAVGDPADTTASVDVKVLRNLVFEGCTTGTSECDAIELVACQGCEVAHNVVYDIYSGDSLSGGGIEGTPFTIQNEGTFYHDNWVVNVAGGAYVVDPGTAVIHNYGSHTESGCAGYGRHYGNVYENCGLDGSGGAAVLFNPLVAEGNFLWGNDAVTFSSAECTTGGGCTRFGIVLAKTRGNSTGIPVTLKDNVIGGSASLFYGAGVYFSGDLDWDPDFDVEADHLTIDNRGRARGDFYGVLLDMDTPTNTTVRVQDMAAQNLNSIGLVLGAYFPGPTEIIGTVFSRETSNPAEGGGSVIADCTDAGVLTLVPSLGYVKDAPVAGDGTLDYTLRSDSPLLAAGAAPPSSPVGIRAFRFDKQRINALWGGVLPFNNEFPANVTTVSNADQDGDGIMDLHDDCPMASNPSQLDADRDGLGDACDSCPLDPANDADGDGVCSSVDNCPDTFNSAQGDMDRDGLGDLCDPCPTTPGGDPDHDGICDSTDNCSHVSNPNQADVDGDGIGDLCDGCPIGPVDDADGDGYCGILDNCPIDANSDQADVDVDGIGDRCDSNDGLILLWVTGNGTIIWQLEQRYSAFNVYRGDLSTLLATGVWTQDPTTVSGAARFCGLATNSLIDTTNPPPLKAFFYMVTGIAGGVEDSLGTSSNGLPRLNNNPCP
jgi:Thrombospondin type 3 repeat